MENNSLIFGKDSQTNIVSIEVDGDLTEIFFEKDGVVSNEWVPNKFWVLSNRPAGADWKKLKGTQHYSWQKDYNNLQDFYKEKAFLKKQNRDLYSVANEKEAYLIINGVTYFKGMKIEDVSTLSFDIETVGLTHDANSKVLLISNTFLKQGKTIRKLFCYDNYESQAKLIEDWCSWVQEINPSVIVGHNIFSYDFPYLDFIAKREQTELKLGRDDSPLKFEKWESKFRVDGSKDLHYYRAHIYGRNIIDTLFLSYKYDIGRKYDNYKLKYIVSKEGLEVKDRQFYDGEKIRDNYKDPIEWVKIKKYAEHDADDSLNLYLLMVPAFFYLTPSIPKTFQQMLYTASGSQINSLLVRSYLQDGYSIAKTSESAPFQGATSQGNSGLYSNCWKADVASLYPSIMLTYSIYDKFKDPAQHFSKMVSYFTIERLSNKKKAKETGNRHYKDLEQAQKIVINSAYGCLGAPGLNYNSPFNANLVTKHGREILDKGMKWCENNKLKIVNCDTDSFMCCNEDQSFIDKERRVTLLKDLNSIMPSGISWEDDGYYSRVCVVKIKNYILKTENGEVKIKGSSLRAPNKEKKLKVFIDKVIEYLLDNKLDEVKQLYNNYVNEVYNLQSINGWVSKKSISDKVLNSERTNEKKVFNAIEGSDYVEGDKCYMYFTKDGSLKLEEKWTNDHDELVLLKKLYNTIVTFETVLNLEEYPNFSLKRNLNNGRIIAGLPPLEMKRKKNEVA